MANEFITNVQWNYSQIIYVNSVPDIRLKRLGHCYAHINVESSTQECRARRNLPIRKAVMNLVQGKP